MAISKKASNEHNKNQMFIDNVKQLMQKRNIKEAELSRLTRIPLTTLHKILSGKTTDPRISTLQSLANYFAATVDELYTGIQDKSQHPEIQSIPILSWNDCVKGKNFIKDLTPSNWSEWITSEYSAPHTYGLISKLSMEPRFPRGTTLIIDPELRPDDGDLIVVVYPDTDTATLRQLFADGPNRSLLSIGPNPSQKKLSEK